MSELAPIVLFVYNRLKHTRQTIEALKKNELSKQSVLIIYCDGPKNNEDQDAVMAVRDYLKTISGFYSINIVSREKNMGLANSILVGVTNTVSKYGKIIVLEDDNVTSPYFLKYMNDALHYYQEKSRVMHISAYIQPIDYIGLPQTFFLRPTTCAGGWGTWKRAWNHFDNDTERILGKFTSDLKRKFNINNSYSYYSHIIDNQKGKLNTWAIFWYASVFFADGLSLHPRQSLVLNIGFDSSGVHSKNSSDYSSDILQKPINSFVDLIQENAFASRRLQEFYNTIRQPLYKRIFKRLFP